VTALERLASMVKASRLQSTLEPRCLMRRTNNTGRITRSVRFEWISGEADFAWRQTGRHHHHHDWSWG
jgi:hypothetical protein